jgi:hypothetical protein
VQGYNNFGKQGAHKQITKTDFYEDVFSPPFDTDGKITAYENKGVNV